MLEDQSGRIHPLRPGDAVASGGEISALQAAPHAGTPAASMGLALFGVGAHRLLAVELSALEASGRGRVVSSPRVVTANRSRALIEQGRELPYQALVKSGVSGVQFRRAGLRLEVTPHITPNGQVILSLDVAKDTVGAETPAGPAVNTKHVQTKVQVDNGGTVAIGGIFLADERDDLERVPWLGRLPVVGALFRRATQRATRSELLIFITPQMVDRPERMASAGAHGAGAPPEPGMLDNAHGSP
jgi:type IV pilus assembly protein PilQ